MDSFLPPNASFEEIENERLFLDVCLNSLDESDPDYLTQREELMQKVAMVDRMLEDRQESRPDTHPETAIPTHELPSSVSLPTRTRNDYDFLDGALDDPFAPTNGCSKRQRASPEQTSRLHKRSRGSFSSGLNSPDSVESEASLPTQPRSNMGSLVTERLQAAAKQREARYQQEKADAEFALSLAARDNGSTSSQPRSQAYLTANGRVQRAPAFPPQMPRTSSSGLQIPGHIKQEFDRGQQRPGAPLGYRNDEARNRFGMNDLADPFMTGAGPSRAPSAYDARRPVKTEPGHTIKTEPSMEDHERWLASLSGDSSAFSSPLHPPDPITVPPHVKPESQNQSWSFARAQPNGHINTPISISSGSDSDSDDVQILNPFGVNASGQQTHLPPPETRYQHPGYHHQVPQAAQTQPYAMPGSFPVQQTQVGSSLARSTMPPLFGGYPQQVFNQGRDALNHAINVLSGDNIMPDRSWRNVEDELHARDMSYLTSDPEQSREDLLKLLDNIRPDEEIPEEFRGEAPPGLTVKLMRHQQSDLGWLKRQEEGDAKGGILADDMGLGKTVQAIALILARPSDDPAVKTTLIIAPVALMRQWQREIENKVAKSHQPKVLIYHGAQKKKMTYAHISTHDIVLTTFGTIAVEYKKKLEFDLYVKQYGQTPKRPQDQPILFNDRAHFWRIIVDEAQNIKNKGTKTAKAVHQLQAVHRLCMTGTPMMNKIEELHSLIKFLRIPPYNDEKRFKQDFVHRMRNTSDPKNPAMKAFQALLKAILLRRLKTSTQDGKPILELPPRSTEIVHAVFDKDQHEFYQSLLKQTLLTMNKYLKDNTVGKNYSNALVLLLRLRQACDHPHLIKDHAIPVDGEIPQDDMEELARQLSDSVVTRLKEADGAFECPICYDAADNPKIFFPCGHDTCAECFTRMVTPSEANEVREGNDSGAKCPECRAKIDPKRILNYNIFLKVFLPEQYAKKFPDEAAKADEEPVDQESEDDSDDDSDSDSDDSQQSLDGFIVRDDEVEYESEVDKKPVKREKGRKVLESDDDDDLSVPKKEDDKKFVFKSEYPTKPKSSKKSSKRKGKGKATDKPNKKTLAQLKKEGMRNKKAKKAYLKRLKRDYTPSAKITKTLEILNAIRENDPAEKTIVFSQFTSFLDLMEIPISEEGMKYERYDGSMNAELRNDAVCNFADKPDVNIMLVSLKAGNAGLNLNCASQVIILDPFWNPFIEEQAIDRAHRIGQQREVQVHRILVAGTVEDRIIELQERKRATINTALDEKAGQQVGRLGKRELLYLFGLGTLPPQGGAGGEASGSA